MKKLLFRGRLDFKIMANSEVTKAAKKNDKMAHLRL